MTGCRSAQLDLHPSSTDFTAAASWNLLREEQGLCFILLAAFIKLHLKKQHLYPGTWSD